MAVLIAKLQVDSLDAYKTEREELEQQRVNFATALNTIGLALSDDTDQQLAQKITQAHEAESLAASSVNSAREMLAKADDAHTTAYDRYQALERERQAVTTSLEGARNRLNELLAEANRGAINLSAGLSTITRQIEELQERLAQTNLALQNANTLLDAQKGVQAAAKATLNTARTSSQQAVQLWNTNETNLQSLTAALNAAGFDSEISDAQLLQRIQEYTALEAVALRLRNRVADLEVAVDTAATSAAFQNMRNRILTNEKLIEQADERTKKIEPWLTYFEDVTNLLGGQQAVATEHFINEYGPRTAVIQQRLRPVYGFGEIEVASKDSAISVRVHRKGKELRPTDYFSQSQVQTLVLGLFLTACSSQTWSGFSSIMMDDPVTHFDDLNTYALLDLILGLQSSPEGERQFVISTCDEKLLQLARQK